MMYFQSKDRYDEVAEFDPDNLTLRVFLHSKEKGRLPKTLEGVYSRIGDHIMALYRKTGRVIFLVDKEEFELTDDTVINVCGPAEARSLVVMKSGKERFTFKYDLSVVPRDIPGDPTPFIDNEDFDFGLFVSNISRSAERKSLV